MAGVFNGAAGRGVRMLCAARTPLRQDVGTTRGESRCLRWRSLMLSTRIFTAAILTCSVLAGLFLLPPPGAVLAIGAAFTVGAWEWAGFGALRGTGARAAYAGGVALLLVLAWRWTAYPKHLLLLLSAA